MLSCTYVKTLFWIPANMTDVSVIKKRKKKKKKKKKEKKSLH